MSASPSPCFLIRDLDYPSKNSCFHPTSVVFIFDTPSIATGFALLRKLARMA